jgi:multidrug resistance efflux pump
MANHTKTAEKAKQTTTTKDKKAPTPRKASFNPVRLWTFIVLGICFLLVVWYLRADRVTPFTSQARLHAVVVPIAPQVSGVIKSVSVKNNQFVDSDQELFQIDKHDYELALQIAKAQFETAKQAVGASAAAVDAARADVDSAGANRASAKANLDSAKAHLDSAKANRVRAQKDARRMRKIRAESPGAISVRRLELADASLASVEGAVAAAKGTIKAAEGAVRAAEGAVAAAKAGLAGALENLGREGDRNSRILQAQANLDHAKSNLKNTTVRAPEKGLVTGVRLDKGHFAATGAPQLTFIATDNFWIQADFTENNLGHIKPGDTVEMVLDVFPGRVFTGTIREMGYGVAVDTAPLGALPRIENKRDWLRDAQRFPVLIDVELPKEEARKVVKVGSQVVAIVYTGDHGISNKLAKLYIRAISILTYAY